MYVTVCNRVRLCVIYYMVNWCWILLIGKIGSWINIFNVRMHNIKPGQPLPVQLSNQGITLWGKSRWLCRWVQLPISANPTESSIHFRCCEGIPRNNSCHLYNTWFHWFLTAAPSNSTTNNARWVTRKKHRSEAGTLWRSLQIAYGLGPWSYTAMGSNSLRRCQLVKSPTNPVRLAGKKIIVRKNIAHQKKHCLHYREMKIQLVTGEWAFLRTSKQNGSGDSFPAKWQNRDEKWWKSVGKCNSKNRVSKHPVNKGFKFNMCLSWDGVPNPKENKKPCSINLQPISFCCQDASVHLHRLSCGLSAQRGELVG